MYNAGLQTAYNAEIQQDTAAAGQVQGGYVASMYDMPQQALSYDQQQQQHATAVAAAAAASVGAHLPSSSASSPEHQVHSAQQTPSHRPVYASAMPQPQPPASAVYNPPAVSRCLIRYRPTCQY